MPTTCLNFTKKCGGCPLLAMPYREQLAQKQARLQELLGGFAPVKAVQGMADPLHYRNKAIASFAAQHGKLVCGLYAEGTHKVLPGADCLLQEDILNKTLAAVLDVLARGGVNMTKLESRPLRGAAWQYVFFVDIGCDLLRPVHQDTMNALTAACQSVRVLGVYPQSEPH